MQKLSMIPEEERPRERLVRLGPKALSNEELLAVILGSGTKELPVLNLARKLLSHFESPKGLMEATMEELSAFPGMGEAKSLKLKAALSLAERAIVTASPQKSPLRLPIHAYEAVLPYVRGEKRELFILILLDVKGRLIKVEVISVGILDATIVHPREVFYPAIKHKAHSLIALHNHPSGDLTPSKEDILMTKSLVKAAYYMKINLLDHLIVSDHAFLSLKEKDPSLFTFS